MNFSHIAGYKLGDHSTVQNVSSTEIQSVKCGKRKHMTLLLLISDKYSDPFFSSLWYFSFFFHKIDNNILTYIATQPGWVDGLVW